MFSVEKTIGVENKEITYQNNLQEHIAALLDAMRLSKCYYIVAINQEEGTRRIYHRVNNLWQVLTTSYEQE